MIVVSTQYHIQVATLLKTGCFGINSEFSNVLYLHYHFTINIPPLNKNPHNNNVTKVLAMWQR